MDRASIKRRAFIFDNTPVGSFLPRVLDVQLLAVGGREHHAVQAIQGRQPDGGTGAASDQRVYTGGLEGEGKVRGPAAPDEAILPARVIIQHVVYQDDTDLGAGERSGSRNRFFRSLANRLAGNDWQLPVARAREGSAL